MDPPPTSTNSPQRIKTHPINLVSLSPIQSVFLAWVRPSQTQVDWRMQEPSTPMTSRPSPTGHLPTSTPHLHLPFPKTSPSVTLWVNLMPPIQTPTPPLPIFLFPVREAVIIYSFPSIVTAPLKLPPLSTTNPTPPLIPSAYKLRMNTTRVLKEISPSCLPI